MDADANRKCTCELCQPVLGLDVDGFFAPLPAPADRKQADANEVHARKVATSRQQPEMAAVTC